MSTYKILQDVFEMRYAKIPDDGPGGGLDLGDSDLDSEDEREKKLLQLQEQLRQMQEQMRILVEESMRSKKRKNKFAPATPGKFNDRYNINGIIWNIVGIWGPMPNGPVFKCHLNTKQPNHLNPGRMDAILFS